MSHNSTSTRKITKSSVDNAIKLVMEHDEKKRRQKNVQVTNDYKISHYCKKFSGDKKSRTLVVGLSKSLALLEMQSYITRQDWKHALNLFPRLLEYPIELEPLIWRYALLILSHTNNSSHLYRFFQQCLGNQNSNCQTLLRKLLSLPLKNVN
ncbi:hypothetical protein PUN28_017436 [Cardiocondyla obscurior]|uniref:Uncharacterized protein n=1 Tax=Cardiocondyla obscurior TaxID=286306 RepID=A0AAW2EH92_9HYME